MPGCRKKRPGFFIEMDPAAPLPQPFVVAATSRSATARARILDGVSFTVPRGKVTA
jgi:phospholipid/cholesterol/gamma-HCH transport system ATP-binding protein